MLVSNTILIKETRLFGEIADSGTGAGSIKMSIKHFVYWKVRVEKI